jgi:hypothetical protein
MPGFPGHTFREMFQKARVKFLENNGGGFWLRQIF